MNGDCIKRTVIIKYAEKGGIRDKKTNIGHRR